MFSSEGRAGSSGASSPTSSSPTEPLSAVTSASAGALNGLLPAAALAQNHPNVFVRWERGPDGARVLGPCSSLPPPSAQRGLPAPE